MSDPSKPATSPEERPEAPERSASDLKQRVAEMLRRSERFVKQARELGRGLSQVSDQDLKIRLR